MSPAHTRRSRFAPSVSAEDPLVMVKLLLLISIRNGRGGERERVYLLPWKSPVHDGCGGNLLEKD